MIQLESEEHMPACNEEDPLVDELELSVTDDQIRKWKFKRKKTVIIFMLQNLLGALNFSIGLPSLWYYLKEVHSPSPTIFYGVILGLAQTNVLIVTIFIGWVADKTRRIKLLLLLTNSLVILGNIIYSVGYSQYIILLGRVFSSLHLATYALIFGETHRCYEPSELQTMMIFFTVFNSLGLIVGPLLNIMLKDINIEIGLWHISFVNAGSVLSLLLFIIMQILILIFVSDLSKEFDLKANLFHDKADQAGEQVVSDNEEYDRNNVNNGHQHLLAKTVTFPIMEAQTSTALEITLQLFKNSTVLVIFFATFIRTFSYGLFDVEIGVLASSILHWNTFDVSMAFVGHGIAYAVSSLIIWTFSKQVSEFNLMLIGTVINIIGFLTLCVIGQYADNYNIVRPFYMNIVVITAASLSVKKITLPSIMGKLIPSEIQNLSESIRFSISRIGRTLGPIIAGVSVHTLVIVGALSTVVCLTDVILMLTKRKILSNPEPLTL